jgi:hypothetical protein
MEPSKGIVEVFEIEAGGWAWVSAAEEVLVAVDVDSENGCHSSTCSNRLRALKGQRIRCRWLTNRVAAIGS